MKIAIYIFMVLALGMIVLNAFQLNPDGWLEGDSFVAVISIMASAIVVVLLLILMVSKKIQKKSK